MTRRPGLALLTLTALEIVLGIDNIIFISILTGKLLDFNPGRAEGPKMSTAGHDQPDPVAVLVGLDQ